MFQLACMHCLKTKEMCLKMCICRVIFRDKRLLCCSYVFRIRFGNLHDKVYGIAVLLFLRTWIVIFHLQASCSGLESSEKT